MPNWCSNTLAVHGPTEDVKKFMEEVKGIEIGTGEDHTSAGDIIENPLSFDRHIPTPRNEDGTLVGEGMTIQECKKLGDRYWYDFNISNWGTKWDACEAWLDFAQNDEAGTATAVYSFETAWSPPYEWLVTVAPLYPTLSFKMEYREEGMGFAGVLGYHKGVQVEQNEYQIYGDLNIEAYDEVYGEALGD